MDAEPYGQADPVRLLQAGIEGVQRLDHAQPGPHGPLGIVLMRQGVAEVDEQAVPEIPAICPSKRAITVAQVS